MQHSNGKRSIVIPSINVHNNKLFMYSISYHALSRYKERYLKTEIDDFDKLLELFFKDFLKDRISMIYGTSYFNKNRKDEVCATFNLKGGVLLGKFDEDFIRFETFISNLFVFTI